MKHYAFWIACSCVVGALARGEVNSPQFPYVGIVRNNAFRLRPVQIEHAEQRLPLPKVSLKGIITVLAEKRALLKVEYPTNTGSATKEESFILSEGQRAGPLEVLSVDEIQATVRVKVSGTPTLLTF